MRDNITNASYLPEVIAFNSMFRRNAFGLEAMTQTKSMSSTLQPVDLKSFTLMECNLYGASCAEIASKLTDCERFPCLTHVKLRGHYTIYNGPHKDDPQVHAQLTEKFVQRNVTYSHEYCTD